MSEFLQTYIIEIGAGVILIGLLKFLYRYLAFRNQEPIEADIVDIKRKVSKKGYSRRYTYPVVEVLQEDGPPKKIYCSTAKKSGHEYYDNYKKMDMLVIKNIKGNVRYIPVMGYWLSSLNILGIGIIIFIISIFV